MRRRLIVGNWKMNKTGTQASAFVRELIKALPATTSIDMVIAPPFTALESVRTALGSSPVLQLGAQNLFWEDHGAYTGEVSASMVHDAGCRFVILGHSERRGLFHEHDEDIGKKIAAALRHGLRPIVCIGESLVEREGHETAAVLTRQLRGSLATLSPHNMGAVSIAYEPIWAIGTGRAATPDQATDAHRVIREFLTKTWSAAVGDETRILYGGSVTPQNIDSLLKSEHVDGALIGGACLQTEAFVKIAAIAESMGVPG